MVFINMIKIRAATINDAEKIAKDNLLLTVESENLKINYETTLKAVKSIIKDKSKGFLIVAEENNDIVGHLMITYEWSDWRNKNIWWIQSVYVDKKHRKQGVFTKMLDHIKNMASENNVDIIRLYAHEDNKNAIKAYEKTNMIKKPYVIYEISSN